MVNPGPITPPPGSPKTWVLMMYTCMTGVLTVALLLELDGLVKLAALPLVLLTGWLLTKWIRASAEELED